MTCPKFEEFFRREHPAFAGALWFGRDGARAALDQLLRERNEFETDTDGGRGDSYRSAQRATSARLTGITALLRMVTGVEELRDLPPEIRLLDVLGGDGLVARALQALAPNLTGIPVLTSDMASHMVAEALRYGFPAVRQSADFLFLRERSFDGVLIAYGAHHIGGPRRSSMCAEAFRVLRPGGRIVLHDFEEGSPMARWFGEIVHSRTVAGHAYRHFTRTELPRLLQDAGFADIKVTEVYDPIRLTGVSEDDAVDALLRYLTLMYGLQLGPGGQADVLDWLVRNMRYEKAEHPDWAAGWLPEFSVRPTPDGAVAELPRMALVGTAVRPDTSP
jgi:SAM-dependent methyltransferase